jgi:tetratricopeptide (TPR) repeat protein
MYTNIQISFSFWLKFLILIILLYPSIIIHELGHAFFGRLVNFEIKRIVIGTGREVFRKKIGNILFILTNNFNAGLTYWGNVSDHNIKFRFGIFLLGGFMAQGVFILICLFYSGAAINEILLFRDVTLNHLFIHANLFLIVVNIIPYNINFMGLKLPNDGLQFLKLPFLNEKDIQNILSAGKIMEGYEYYEAKKYPESEIIFKECSTLFPKAILPKINLSAALIKQLKLEQAQLFLEKQTPKFDNDPFQFLIYNNLTWTLLLNYDNESLEKADLYSKKAFKLNSKNRYVQGTRGCVLIERGEVEKGIQILKKIVMLNRPIDDKLNTLVGFIYLAYGLYLNEKIDIALCYIQKIIAYQTPIDADYQKILNLVLQRTNNMNGSIDYNPKTTK